jgi:hypothetical protein
LKTLIQRIRNKRSKSGGSESLEKTNSTPFDFERLSNQYPDAAEYQIKIIQSVSSDTMTSPERIMALCQAVEYLETNSIAGDVVECGVWRGGSMAAVARTLKHFESGGQCQRNLWLYDTFDGMSEPTDQDVDYQGQTAKELMDIQSRDKQDSVWCCSPLDHVKQVIGSTGYDSSRVNYVEGKVEETLPLQSPDKIALLRLDTDWYESTRCELEILFPKLVPGGVLIIDDYGHWDGCRRAVDEYFANNQIAMLLNRIDYTGRIGVHCPASQ